MNTETLEKTIVAQAIEIQALKKDLAEKETSLTWNREQLAKTEKERDEIKQERDETRNTFNNLLGPLENSIKIFYQLDEVFAKDFSGFSKTDRKSWRQSVQYIAKELKEAIKKPIK